MKVGNYIQPLWEEIKPATDTGSPCELQNGSVEAVTTLLGAGLALILGFTKVLENKIQFYVNVRCFVLVKLVHYRRADLGHHLDP